MRNPLLHGGHGNSIDFVPIFYFMIVEMLIMNHSALKGKSVGQDYSLFG
jgi:hypothetical protein